MCILQQIVIIGYEELLSVQYTALDRTANIALFNLTAHELHELYYAIGLYFLERHYTDSVFA